MDHGASFVAIRSIGSDHVAALSRELKKENLSISQTIKSTIVLKMKRIRFMKSFFFWDFVHSKQLMVITCSSCLIPKQVE